jgi:hypothetical protein
MPSILFIRNIVVEGCWLLTFEVALGSEDVTVCGAYVR